MADLSAEKKKKEEEKEKEKRKLKSPEEKQRGPKKHRVDESKERKESKQKEFEPFEAGRAPWKNLDLILLLRNKEIDLQKKIERALTCVNSRAKGEIDVVEDCETVKLSRLILFLNDWVQSLLLSTGKKVNNDGEKPSSRTVEACLDYRCWVIFKFCLEESLRLQLSLNLSRNLLRAIGCIARTALSLLVDRSINSKESFFVGEGFELYDVSLDCVSLVFSSHGGLSNENLDLWISTVRALLEIVQKVYEDSLEGGQVGIFALRFSCLVLEPFAKFLRVHPTRKSSFHGFVDDLLELLLYVLIVLHRHCNVSNHGWPRNLLIMVEEVISQGLFHPIHVDGFMSLCSSEKHSASSNVEPRTVVKSYHRHLFDKLERIIAERKEYILSGLGELFHLLVDRVKRPNKVSVLSGDSKIVGKAGDLPDLLVPPSNMLHKNNNAAPENSNGPSNLNAEKRKSLFDFFVQIMEPLLLQMNGYLKTELENGLLLFNVHHTVKSINSLLTSLLNEKLYSKTEDISEGACLNFLQKVYGSILLFSNHLLSLSTCDMDKQMQETLISLARELLVAIGYLLDIEYEVIGNDSTSLWTMILCYLAIGDSFKDASNHCLLTSQLLGLGCQVLQLYGELRQVKTTIFALCKAMRLIMIHENVDDGESNHGSFLTNTILPYESYAKSVGLLLCTQSFRLALHDGIKSIPEGQVREVIQHLSLDLSESLEWMKSNCSVADHRKFNLQEELFGRGLSEVYTLVLDSLTITIGNSVLVGQSVQDLMTVVRPCMSSLVGQQPDGVNEFVSCITGSSFSERLKGKKHDMLKCGLSTCWVFVFIFHLYVSCRSLYRQAISLMPPDISRKMSGALGDSSMAYSKRDFLERTDWTNEGYFSWIIQPSAPLPVIIQSVSDTYFQGSTADSCPLAYLLHTMALQRLVDLNRQIKLFEYIGRKLDGNFEIKVLTDSSYRKQSRKCRRSISLMKQEAANLTEFMMSYLSLVGTSQISVTDSATCMDTFDHTLHMCKTWDLGICYVNKKSLPAAIWSIVCKNIDIWFIHASKKKLKMFLSHVISTSLPSTAKRFTKMGEYSCDETVPLNTLAEISLALLHNASFYDYNFVRRHLAKRFCLLLEKSVRPLFTDISIGDIGLKSSSNWEEVLSALENSSGLFSGNNNVNHKEFSGRQSISHLSCEMLAAKFRACQSLLSLLSWMPKGYMNSKSFSLCVTYLLNLERIAIASILACKEALSPHEKYEIVRLLMLCRRALKFLIMAYCEKKTGTTQSSFISIFPGGILSVLWLFKSMYIVVGFQETLSEDFTDDIRYMFCSLMDHTSYVFLTLTKYECIYATEFLNVVKPDEEQLSSNVDQKHSPSEFDPCLNLCKDVEAWKSIVAVAESLKEQTQNLLILLKDALYDKKVGDGISVVNFTKLSSMVSSFGGFLWGLASALNHTNKMDSDPKVKLLTWEGEPASRINLCIAVFVDFICFVLCKLLGEADSPGHLCYVHNFKRLNNSCGMLDSKEFSIKIFRQTDILCGKQHQKSEIATACRAPSDIGDDSHSTSMCSHGMLSEDADSVASVLCKIDSFECEIVNADLLGSLLEGNNHEAAILIRHLLIAYSAILRLHWQTGCSSLLSILVPGFLGICEVLMLKLADMVVVPESFSFVWLDGVLKFLQELGSYFPSTNPTLTRHMYAKLVGLHLKVLGKCISLQGKEATLASHEIDSSAKTLHSIIGSTKASVSCRIYWLDEFKARLRMSLKMLMEKPSELHMLSAVQAIERALVGVHEGCTIIYGVNVGSADGGKASATVAAGIDCLDLVLEYVSGRNRLSVVKRHIQSLTAALFNIILHLQSPLIFYSRLPRCDSGPHTGAVILMCVEVLTRILAKHALFHLDSWHVAQSLRIPSALFQDFGQLRASEGPISSNPFLFLDNQDCDQVAGMNSNSCVVDHQFSIELFAKCCRLLSTIVKHRQSESEQCIALLQESVRALLHHLETVDADYVIRKGCFSWNVKEGEKCACFFRRIFEELRQQKDTFGQHCYKFLADYIWIYSGLGPQKTGIRREIDEALKPGVYALIDVCSSDDLQHIHFEFGEGPCRNTLAMLQHDYKLNFQYEGKV
uniref:Nucleolar 27S pre-rRNA processing Urb2/Npa2 C-terminal domain-containing protein n=1 Tax=Rhizophora mucronata TaxID=61149 RepID=A0A2P2J3V6_RHIMU